MDALLILNKWQQFIKETNISIINVPVGISFLVSGKFIIKWSLSESMVIFNTTEECLSFIDKTINDFNKIKG